MPAYDSFDAFWPRYLSEHSHPLNRRLHFTGTLLALLLLLCGLLLDPRLLLAVPVAGYGLAWLGHYGVEKNRPATFSYPLWSLRGDLRMFGLMATGRLDGELARIDAGGKR